MNQIKYPVGIQTFEEIRNQNYLYIDKTADIYRLISEGKYIFLSRPRRFGKSLLLSTIRAYFEGKRELFRDLAIDKLTDGWDSFPVLYLDLNSGEFSSPSGLSNRLNKIFTQWETLYGKGLAEDDFTSRFEGIIQRAYEKTGKQVVILIDEYDKPLLQNLHNQNLLGKYRTLLKALYSNLKTQDRYIKFAMLTGVARFSKLSVFSDLNNLRDISFEDKFSTICGVTADELDFFFKKGISELADLFEMSESAVREELKKNYDGYHFTEKCPDIYNPYSLMNVFAAQKFSNYWVLTGTPTFLAEMIYNSDLDLRQMDNVYYSELRLQAAGITSRDPEPIMYQSGYLTIKGYDKEGRDYILGYPNNEVEEAFIELLLPLFLGRVDDEGFDIGNFKRDLFSGNVGSFMNRLSALTSSLPYTNEKRSLETRFQDVVYMVFKLLGFIARTEIHTSEGRIDITLESSRYVNIFEFKIDATADEAMKQIEERHYWKPFEASGKQINLIGASFDSHNRALLDWVIKSIE